MRISFLAMLAEGFVISAGDFKHEWMIANSQSKRASPGFYSTIKKSSAFAPESFTQILVPRIAKDRNNHRLLIQPQPKLACNLQTSHDRCSRRDTNQQARGARQPPRHSVGIFG